MKRSASYLLLAAIVTCGCESNTRPTSPLLPSSFRKNIPASAAAVTRPAPTTQAQPATAPATAPIRFSRMGVAAGQYQTVGGVVSEVNGNPIYANQVIRALRPELAARAKEMNFDQFKKLATDEIRSKIIAMQRDELVFGAADRYLEDEDRRLAELLTMQYRTKLITEAGGSVELAERKAQVEGDTFEQIVYDRYRRYMSELYYQKRVYPRIKVSAEDMRTYYNANVGRQFTEFDEVVFRLIKVDSRKWGGKDSARRRAEEIANRVSPENFAEIASKQNDDPRLAAVGGQEVPLQKGAYRLEKVEAQLWETQAGQVTPVIEDSGGFYIAKVESRKTGRVVPFDDRKVQDSIYKALRDPQLLALREEIDQNLRRNSMVWPSTQAELNEMMQIAVEMAVKNYPVWAAKGPTTAPAQ